MKVAIVHDAFVQDAGGERVAQELVRAFPGAPLYAAAFRTDRLPRLLAAEDISTSFVQPLVRRGVPLTAVAPFLPAAFATIHPREADVVISSSSAFAHHVRAPKGAVHLCYCHTPPRFLWEPPDYFLRQPWRRTLTWPGRAIYRNLDRAAAARVDQYVANSRNTAEKIRRAYGRESVVVYPPVDVDRFEPSTERSGRFLVVARLRNQKRIDVAVQAANLAGLPLDIIGDGPERAALERLAGPTVRFLGRRHDDEVGWAMARAAGVLVPAVADFGLTIVEAQASGRPPIAYAAGGALETVDDGRTGFFFDEQTPETRARAMRRALDEELPPEPLVAAARRFEVGVFRSGISAAIDLALEGRRIVDDRGLGRETPLAAGAQAAATSEHGPRNGG